MNDIYNRLKRLISGLGFSFEDGGITKAEIKAYSVGIGLVRDILSSYMNLLTLKSDNKNDLLPYCNMLSVNADSFDIDELRDYIYSRMSGKYAFPSATEFDNAFNKLVAGAYQIADGKMKLFNVGFDRLWGLGEFIKGYVPFCSEVVFSGNGMTFNQWDSLGKTWNEYDGVSLPFDIIDKLGGDNI